MNNYIKYNEIHKDSHLNIFENLASKIDSGGMIRSARGELVETLVERIWQDIDKNNTTTNKKHTCTSKSGLYTIEKALDRNLYKNGKLVAMVECKAYLDSCYLERAIFDSIELKNNNFNVPMAIVSLENGLSDSSYKYFMEKNVIDKVFFLVPGKRQSTKPLYKQKFFKDLDEKSVNDLVSWMLGL